jgi:hypothetical protein
MANTEVAEDENIAGAANGDEDQEMGDVQPLSTPSVLPLQPARSLQVPFKPRQSAAQLFASNSVPRHRPQLIPSIVPQPFMANTEVAEEIDGNEGKNVVDAVDGNEDQDMGGDEDEDTDSDEGEDMVHAEDEYFPQGSQLPSDDIYASPPPTHLEGCISLSLICLKT